MNLYIILNAAKQGHVENKEKLDIICRKAKKLKQFRRTYQEQKT